MYIQIFIDEVAHMHGSFCSGGLMANRCQNLASFSLYLNGTSCVHLRIKLSYIFNTILVLYWNYLDNLQLISSTRKRKGENAFAEKIKLTFVKKTQVSYKTQSFSKPFIKTTIKGAIMKPTCKNMISTDRIIAHDTFILHSLNCILKENFSHLQQFGHLLKSSFLTLELFQMIDLTSFRNDFLMTDWSRFGEPQESCQGLNISKEPSIRGKCQYQRFIYFRNSVGFLCLILRTRSQK